MLLSGVAADDARTFQNDERKSHQMCSNYTVHWYTGNTRVCVCVCDLDFYKCNIINVTLYRAVKDITIYY